MPIPLMGTRKATLLALAEQQIHGQSSFRVKYRFETDPPDQTYEGLVAREALYPGAKAGDNASLKFAMGNLVEVIPFVEKT